MRPAIFFGYLCFLLLKGNNAVYTGTQHNGSCYTQAQQNEKSLQVKFTDTNEDYTTIKNRDADEQKEHMLCEDVEDEDTNDVIARKYRLLASCDLTGANCFNLWYLHTRFKTLQPFYKLLSSTYTIKSVLRI